MYQEIASAERNTTTPTQEIHAELDIAYAHFNHCLFDGHLPSAMICLVQRRGNVRGHFAAERYERREGSDKKDEIALNPKHFKDRTPLAILSTLVHEMVHLQQHHFAKRKPQSGWHGQEWAADMVAIGLIPTDTGLPGGKMTGRAVTHIVKPGGRFWTAAKALLDSGKVRCDWVHREWIADPTWRDLKAAETAGWSGKKVKYWCPTCPPKQAVVVWGRHGQRVLCGCGRPANSS